MRRNLLDINVLIALLDSDHVDHERATAWLEEQVTYGWASCAITQNGFVRIISQPRYPSPIPPSQAIRLLAQATRTEHHEFWDCDLSLLNDQMVDPSQIHGSRQVTDVYLLALATKHAGTFVTFDQMVPSSAVTGAKTENLAIL